MKRREILLIGGATLIAGCSTTSGGSSADPAAKRRALDAEVDGAISQLVAASPEAGELAGRAQGVLVFPSVVTAGFVVGGSYGQGALRKHGVTVAYYSVSAGSIGLLAGAQSKAMYLLFMTQEAMQKFESSPGWTAGADASVALAQMGADAHISTETVKAPIIGFVRTNAGFMANLSFDGTKFNKIEL